MINKLDNIQKNLMIKHMNNSDVLAYNKDILLQHRLTLILIY